MNRTVIALLSVGILLSSAASAATLGKLNVESGIGQPLKIRIPITIAKQDAHNKITATLAPVKINDAIAKQQRVVLDDLNFAVVSQDGDNPYIQVTSQKPVNQPILRLPIRISWQDGELLREYTLFLDPPKEHQKKALVQHLLPTTTRQQVTVPNKVNSAKVTVNHKKRVYGPTRSNDRLWKIAKAYHPSGSKTSVQQLTLAIFLANPHAFIHGNMNVLKRNQYLRIPTLHAASAYSQRKAVMAINHNKTLSAKSKRTR